MPHSPLPGKAAPDLSVPLIIGTHWNLAAQKPDFMTMIVVFRGLHCPICETYLQDLRDKLPAFVEKGVSVLAVSMETKDRTQTIRDDWDTGDLPLAHDLSVAQAADWGLFVSEKIKDGEPDLFSEPGLFWVQPDGTLYYSNVATMPFGRPDFEEMLKRIDFVKDKSYPPRGTHEIA